MPLARIKGQETRSIKEGISVDEMQSTEIRDVKFYSNAIFCNIAKLSLFDFCARSVFASV